MYYRDRDSIVQIQHLLLSLWLRALTARKACSVIHGGATCKETYQGIDSIESLGPADDDGAGGILGADFDRTIVDGLLVTEGPDQVCRGGTCLIASEYCAPCAAQCPQHIHFSDETYISADVPLEKGSS